MKQKQFYLLCIKKSYTNFMCNSIINVSFVIISSSFCVIKKIDSELFICQQCSSILFLFEKKNKNKRVFNYSRKLNASASTYLNLFFCYCCLLNFKLIANLFLFCYNLYNYRIIVILPDCYYIVNYDVWITYYQYHYELLNKIN